ncbi:MAG TPA: hypothetical protein VHV29_15440 [Terriglobales bacterium]|jgi:hypothetical protein|nr:hypothetical protein [Terriglobales bacterium]
MSRKYLLLALSVFLSSIVVQAATRDLIPAGTLLHCTMDEPNFSAKTAQVGDPVLCNLGPLGTFGHSVFPRGAELSGHLQDYKNPGHFFGKGWMAIEFDRMILPGAQVLPLAAKVINAPHNKVDAKGDIKGKGHPTRDALLWTVPVFWPSKILTLPARGPFPTLKGETRLTLRLMEDVEVPFAVANNNVPRPDYRPSAYRGSSSMYQPASTSRSETLRTDDSPVRRITYSQPRSIPSQRQGQLTVIALQSGMALLASRYWVEGTDLHCVSQTGAVENVPLTLVDLAQTVKVNQQRNMDFSLHSRPVRERTIPVDDESVVQQ